MIVYIFLGAGALLLIWATIKIEFELHERFPKQVEKAENWFFDKFCK